MTGEPLNARKRKIGTNAPDDGDLTVIYRDPRNLQPDPRNARTHSEEQIAQIRASIRQFGFTNPILLRDDDATIGAGHGRQLGALAEGLERVPTITLHGLTEIQWRAYAIADNQLALNAGWDVAILKAEFAALRLAEFDVAGLGFSSDQILAWDLSPGGSQSGRGSLAERFLIPPFSVFNAREGWWQDRKRAWLALGIQSELGRGDTAVNSPHEGRGMADGLLAVRAKQKASRVDTNPGGGGRIAPIASSAARLPNATPGGSLMPAADYAKRQRGDGKGRAIG